MNRFRVTDSGYRFDKLIILGGWGIILFILFCIALINKFDFTYHPYFECKGDICLNPLFSESKVECRTLLGNCKMSCQGEWCKEKYLTKGVYGEKPGYYSLELIGSLFALIILCSVLLNHFVHNRHKRFDLGLDQLDWMRWIKKMEVLDENDKNKPKE